MPNVNGHLPSFEAIPYLEVDVLSNFREALLSFEERVDLFLEAFCVGENFLSVFYDNGKIFSAKLLEFSVLHPEYFDKAEVVPSDVGMLGAMVFVEGVDLFGGFGGNLLEFDFGGQSEPDL